MASRFKFWLAVILAIGFLFFCDGYLGEYSLGIVNNIAIFITLAISYNLINGVTGQFSLEPNGFVAVGAYVAAILLLNADSKLYQFDAAEPSNIILAIYTSNFILAMFISGVCATL
ncbi:MAG: branched-chain amino acid ABC transporter permease, partial [Campylobacter sp.]|nr:branched-chain amino acid ABC transporter permease [Campylobacter sp.]